MVGLYEYFAKKRGTPALASHTRISTASGVNLFCQTFATSLFKVGSVGAELRQAGALARGAPV
jgi:hypothetical protein